MSVKIEEAGSMWVVFTNSDLTEGRGYRTPIEYCQFLITARRLAVGRGVQGHDADVVELPIVDVDAGADKSIYRRFQYGPIRLVAPSKEDEKQYNNAVEKCALAARKMEIIKKISEFLTDEEIEFLLKGAS